MKSFWALSLLLAGPILQPSVFGQADGCRGSLELLNRVKEEITPELSAQNPDGKERLAKMARNLSTATNVCKDVAELWYYRMIINDRLGQRDAYVEKKYREFPVQRYLDPFSPLPPGVSVQAAPQLAPKEEKLGPIRNKWALVVGIDQFEAKAAPTLRYAVKDSADFSAFLRSSGGGRFDTSRLIHLTNDRATLQGIREGLGLLRANVDKDDLVVVYFASHGSPRDLDPNGVSYIITHDSNLDDSAKLYATSLQMIDLVQLLNREIKARRVVLILDTCYSGDAAGARGLVHPVWVAPPPPAEAPATAAFSGALQTLKSGYGRAVITATRANEQSFESEDLMNGYFTHYLIQAMKEEQGMRPLGSVFAKVREQVSSVVGRELGKAQTPSSEFNQQAAEIIIGAPESH
jgi:uncharacterized caspase-like protein